MAVDEDFELWAEECDGLELKVYRSFAIGWITAFGMMPDVFVFPDGVTMVPEDLGLLLDL